MSRIIKIIENRHFRSKNQPFKILEKRLCEAFELESKVKVLKFSKQNQEHAIIQMIVFSISCFESYLREMVNRVLREGLVPAEKFYKIRKLKRIRLTLKEMEIIEKRKIKISELISNEINFQNFEEIMTVLKILEFGKYLNLARTDIESGNVGFTKKESERSMQDLIKFSAKARRKTLANNRLSSLFSKMVIRNLYRSSNLLDKEKMLGTIRIGIYMRNKIVHNAAKIKMPDRTFHVGLLLAVIEVSSILQEAYNKKKGEATPSPPTSPLHAP